MKPLETPQSLHPRIGEHLRRFVQRRRRLAMARAIALVLMLEMLWLISWAIVDRFESLSSYLRWVLLAGQAGVLMLMLWRPIAALLRRRIDWCAAAMQLERCDRRFGESLTTVVSRRLDLRNRRTTPTILDQLIYDVQEKVTADSDLGRVLPLRPVMSAWVAAGVAAAVLGALCALPWLGLPSLIGRQLAPWGGLTPVTNVRLVVKPGSTDIVLGQPLPIIARPQAAFLGGVTLQTTTDGENWTSIGMAPMADGSFAHTLSSPVHDTTYRILAGDAIAGPFTARVLRRPVAMEFRTRLTYPAYVGREPLMLISTQGSIEAPAKSVADVTVLASEPLSAATLSIDGTRVPSQPTDDPRARQFRIDIARDARMELEMVSDRDVHGSGPSDMRIRAVPDRPPIVQFLLPAGDLFMRARDAELIPYRIVDDYGVSQVEARIEIHHRPAIRRPVGVGADPRHIEGAFPLNLAEFNVAIGDIITLRLQATDRGGLTTNSEPCQLFVAALTVSADQRRRIEELREATRLAQSITNDLNAAARAVDQRARALAKIASASQSATLLVRSLVRVGQGLRSQQIGDSLASLTDAAQVQASRLERASTDADSDSPQAMQARIAGDMQAAARIQPLVAALGQGLGSEVLFAERRGLLSVVDPDYPAAMRLRDEIDTAVSDLGIDPLSVDLDSILLSRVTDAADQLIRSTQPVDLVGLSRQWAAPGNTQELFLADRLAAAGQIESARGDADPSWARDLQLASRAARSIDRRSGATTRPLAAARQAFSDALLAMARERDLARTPVPESAEQIRAAADAARKSMQELGGGGGAVVASQNMPAPERLGSAAQPNAARGATPAPSTQPSDLRGPALDAIRRAQQDLTELPQQLGRIEQLSDLARQAMGVAAGAGRDAESATPIQQPAARRAVEVAGAQVDEAFEDLSEAAQAIDADQMFEVTRELMTYLPRSSSAAIAIGGQFEPALVRLRDRIAARDPDGIDQALSDTRRSIAAVQESLREARQTFLEQDPVNLARWFAEQTPAVVPAIQPNDPLAVLQRTWDDSLQRAAEELVNGGRSAMPRAGQKPRLNRNDRTASPNAEFPGFQDSLRVYFQVLSRGSSENSQ